MGKADSLEGIATVSVGASSQLCPASPYSFKVTMQLHPRVCVSNRETTGDQKGEFAPCKMSGGYGGYCIPPISTLVNISVSPLGGPGLLRPSVQAG